MKRTAKLDRALAELRRLIEMGAEYADAHTNVIWQHKLTTEQGEELQRMYDEATS